MIRILPNGGKVYIPAPTSQTTPTRTACAGWTRAVSRRNCDFLQSVESSQLTGHGYALSLTIRECPDSPQDWQNLRQNFVKRLRRMGMIRMHWLTEWQRRGCPHLHAAVWFSDSICPSTIYQHWLEAANRYSAGFQSQHVRPITGAPGWFEYLAKHGARSVSNYQRSPENVPAAWDGKTGRMWGHLGDWPTSEAKTIEAPPAVELQYRRLMIRYQIGKARRQRDHQRVRYFQRYLSRAPKETSRAAALPRLWLSEDDQWALLHCAFRSHS